MKLKFFSSGKKPSKNISLSLALRFMLLLAFAMLSLTGIFILLLQLAIVNKQDSQLEESIELISQTVESEGIEEVDFLELPYFITYTIYQKEEKNILSTNDALLPLLESEGKSRTYFQKDYFTDSDLNIRFLTRKILLNEKEVTVEVALDIANDSAAQMLTLLPRLALLSLLPLLFLSFALSFLISRKTISAVKKLQEDYNREKAFTSNVSHELKTPISIIDGHANLLKRWGKDDPAQLSQSIDAILHETENMNSIVTTLLDMSRLEMGKIKVEKAKFYVTNLFMGLKEEFQTIHPKMKFELSDPDYLEIESDRNKLHQIFTVILSNSVKFAGEDCKITLAAKKSGNRICLSASDNGPGFPPEALAHVFDRFYKGDSSHDRNVSGAGLGLSIGKSLAESLGAQISAENLEIEENSSSKIAGACVKILF
ncbi:MAG: HAMP domain-containing histidine kinase [Treponema sp.]|nr:HAMP domain-containing histidine kinase [Treponema sp.]